MEIDKNQKPENRDQLQAWVQQHLNLHLAKTSLCEHHQVPLDYLEYVFLEHGDTADVVVWAPRGGGKTMLGAVSTLLDMLFKPGIQVRILGGSREQSDKMYAYLRKLVENNFADRLAGKITKKGLTLDNGSAVEILTQSETAVRGVRVQKLRCDEIELFKRGVWEAAQLTTRTLDGPETGGPGDRENDECRMTNDEANPKAQNPNEPKDAAQRCARGGVEVFSTMHKVNGLMQGLVRAGEGHGEMDKLRGGVINGRKLFVWCIWDVIARCSPRRICEKCKLQGGCQGRARSAEGFIRVPDVLAMKQRVSRQQWEAEVLCFRPYTRDQVFHAFCHPLHVRDAFVNRPPASGDTVMVEERLLRVEKVVAGVDFGWAQFVCLWMAMLRDPRGHLVVWVLDELAPEKKSLQDNITAMQRRPGDSHAEAAGAPWDPWRVYCDVAGRQHDPHTGETSEAILRRAGFAVRSRGMEIEDGIGMLNVLIDPAWNSDVDKLDDVDDEGTQKLDRGQRFFVNTHCAGLIKALEGYARAKNGKAVKDGQHDHYIDALRYAVAGYNDPKDGVVMARNY